MNKRFSAAAISTIALLLAGCGAETNDDSSSSSSAAPSTPAETEVHALKDTVKVGDGVTISDVKLSTNGCGYESDSKEDLVKFELIATVENRSKEEIKEALCPREINFKDSEGMTSSTADYDDSVEPCESENKQEFNGLKPGDKRRAAVTLVAPRKTVEIAYATELIPNAQTVKWDVETEFKKLKNQPVSDSPVPTTAQSAPQETYQAPAPDTVTTTPTPEAPIGYTGAPGHSAPAPMDKTIASCGSADMYQRGTTFFTDGTSGWTQQCANQ